jgi:hypothetical protein
MHLKGLSIGASTVEHLQKESVKQSDKQLQFLEKRTSGGEEDSVAGLEAVVVAVVVMVVVEEEEEDLAGAAAAVEWEDRQQGSMVRDDSQTMMSLSSLQMLIC